MTGAPVSLRRRLLVQLLGLAALLSVGLYFTVRTIAEQAAEVSLDGVLGAATLAIAEGLSGGEDGIEVDLPYSAFSILGSISEDRVFYRIDVAGVTATGYPDLPAPPEALAGVAPSFYSATYRDAEVRIAAMTRTLLIKRTPQKVLVLVAQTRLGQTAIADSIAQRAAIFGIGFFALAVLLSILMAGSALAPIARLAEAVGRRGPRDLRPVNHPTPRELEPLLAALNGFITRLRNALSRTETFIAEAAHHIRTPLATVRTRAEIALRQSTSEETSATLRAVIRAVEESSRSASQLLDHATVVYRSDRLVAELVDLARLIAGLAASLGPTADLKDVVLQTTGTEQPLNVVCDRLLVESALRNLIDNALKYSPAEGEIIIALQPLENGAEFTVSDRGRGLGGRAQAALSQRFARGSNVDDIVGSGLGLTIVEEVAAAHGGRFTLTDQEGGGTCARFWLPLR